MSETLGDLMARQAVERLNELVRAQGRGALTRLSQQTGRSRSWWRKIVRVTQDPRLSDFFRVLLAIGRSPERFFREFAIQPEPLVGPTPTIVSEACKRVALRDTSGQRDGEALLERLDRQRYEEPARVVELARQAVPEVALEVLPRLLGVAGSAYRFLDLHKAEHCIRNAIHLNGTLEGTDSVTGELYQRLSYVAGSQGDHREALRLAERAMSLYVRADDSSGAGRALVAQGNWLYYLEDTTGSIRAENRGLAMLPASESRHRFGAFVTLAHAHHRLGDLASARRAIDHAEEYATEVSEAVWGKLLWLKSTILVDLGEIKEAEKPLRRVIELYRTRSPVDSALATIDLMECQIKLGRHDQAVETAKSMAALLQPLRHNDIASAAITELLRGGSKAVRLSLLERLRETIERTREHRSDRCSRS